MQVVVRIDGGKVDQKNRVLNKFRKVLEIEGMTIKSEVVKRTDEGLEDTFEIADV